MQKTTIVISPRERYSSIVVSLKSLFSTVPANVPVIVVEGGSPDTVIRDLQMLRKTRYFELVSRPHKITPNEARNIGAGLAKSEYVVFADNDIEYEPGWLEALEGNADQNLADMVAPLTFVGPAPRPIIHQAGGDLVVTKEKGAIRLHEVHRLSNADFEERRASIEKEAPLVNEICEFHCMLIRREFFMRIGGLDERLITREHMDLALRAKILGAKITFEHSSHITYLALNTFSRSDLNYFLFRWSRQLAIRSINAFQKTWGVKLNRKSLLRSSIGRRRMRAVGSVYASLRRLLGDRLFKGIVISPLDFVVTKWSLKTRDSLEAQFSPGKPDVEVRDKIIAKMVQSG